MPDRTPKPAGTTPREVLGASLPLTVLLVAFFWRAIFLGETWLPNDLVYELDPIWWNHAPADFTAPGNRLLSDVVYFHYPWQVEMRRALAEQRLPLWTPRINNGQPMLGNGQIGAWDPVWLIARLFPLDSSFLVAAFLKLWIGGLSTFLLARELGIGRRGSALAMIVFAFSGPMIVWLNYTVSSVAAWLPLLLYLSERAQIKQSTALFPVIGIVLACQFFSGHPETSFQVTLIWIAFCLVRAVMRDGWQVRRLAWLLSRMMLAATIGVALAAVQLLPTIASILNSAILTQRQTSIPTSLVQTALLDWHEWPTLITVILPQFFGTPIDGSYWYPYQNYNEQTLYVGIVPVSLGIVASLAAWQAHQRGEAAGYGKGSIGFWIGLTLLALGLAIRLPVFSAVDLLPVFGLVNHGRLRIVCALGLAILSGYGLDALTSSCAPNLNVPRKFLNTVSAMAVISLIAIGGAYAGITVLRDQFIAMGQSQAEAMKAIDHPMYPYSLEYYYARVDTRYTQTRSLYTLETPRMFLPVGMALGVGVLEWLRRRRLSLAVQANALVLLTCIDLFLFGIQWNPAMQPDQVFPPTEAVKFLTRQPGLFRVSGLYLALMPNTGMAFGLSDTRGYDAVVPWRQAALFDRLDGATRVGHYGIIRSADSRLLDLMNVEYVITDTELNGRWELAFAETDSPIKVYRNSQVMPRAFLVHQVEPAATPEEALADLLDERFDFRSRVILEGSQPPLPSVAAPLAQSDRTHVVQYEADRVIIETASETDGILVLTDTYAPGWHVRVDGQPADIYVADFAFRAVALPAGQHRVEFVYAPASVTAGAALSLTAAICCVIWGAALLYRKAR